MAADPMTPLSVVARTLWGEARGDGVPGMHAVANVIGNRVRNPRWWGRDWIGVCTKPWQFSCWNEGDPNRAKLLAVTAADPEYAEAIDIARRAIAGELPDITDNADSYYAIGSPAPFWVTSATFTAQIGRQLFYRTELPAPAASTPAA